MPDDVMSLYARASGPVHLPTPSAHVHRTTTSVVAGGGPGGCDSQRQSSHTLGDTLVFLCRGRLRANDRLRLGEQGIVEPLAMFGQQIDW